MDCRPWRDPLQSHCSCLASPGSVSAGTHPSNLIGRRQRTGRWDFFPSSIFSSGQARGGKMILLLAAARSGRSRCVSLISSTTLETQLSTSPLAARRRMVTRSHRGDMRRIVWPALVWWSTTIIPQSDGTCMVYQYKSTCFYCPWQPKPYCL